MTSLGRGALRCSGTGAAGGVNLQEVLYKEVRTAMLPDTECEGLFWTPENANEETKLHFQMGECVS